MHPKELEALNLSEQESREIITPFAFKINKDLLGLPLASPWRRALAIIIDAFLILVAAKISAAIIAVIVALGFYKSSDKQFFPNTKNWLRKMLKVSTALALFVTCLFALSQLINFLGDESTVQPVPEVSTQIDNQHNEANTTSLIAWSKGIISDLGLGFGWAAVYFTLFTLLWRGQTPGKKLMGIRVIALSGEYLNAWDAFGRYGGYGAGFATGLLGFIQIFWDPNRQAIQDKISATVVIRGSLKTVQPEDLKKHSPST